MNREYYIWSIEHGRWWGINGVGYVSNLSDAGRYSEKDAMRIIKSANIGIIAGWQQSPNEALVPCDTIDDAS